MSSVNVISGGSLSVTSVPYAMIILTSGNYTYIAKANPGVSSTSASWQAFRFDESTQPVTKLWADGNSNFDNQADNLSSLTYS